MSFSGDIYYDEYHRENLPLVMNLIENDLSEPYSIFTYHYFLEDHPHLCLTAWECDGEILKSHEKDLNDGKKVHFYPDFDINIHPKSNIQLKPITGEASNSVSNFSEDKENIIKGQDFRKRRLVGVIIGKTGVHGKVAELSCMRGYIGMLAVSEDFRGRGIGKSYYIV